MTIAKALMSSQGGTTTKYYRLERLCKWEHVDKVNHMLMTESISPGAVAKWCRENEFFISNPKMYEYKELLLLAISRRTTVDALIGLNKPNKIRQPILLPEEVIAKNATKVKNELEVLDLIIQKGFDNLSRSPGGVKVGDALKAIEMKNKITQGSHGGFTDWGLQQLRALEEAKFNAVVEAVKQYIPEEHWEELDDAIKEAEYNFYKENAPEYLDDYEDSVGKEDTEE